MRVRFIENFNFNTGAVTASPGDVPAFTAYGGNPTGGYSYEWVRDGALSMRILMEVADTPVGQAGQARRVSNEMLNSIVPKYVERVAATFARFGQEDIRAEPRFNLVTGDPLRDSWCRPQTDGPALRALAMIAYAKRPHGIGAAQDTAWRLASDDLDWLAKPENVNRPSCDLWEEDLADGNLLWNRILGQRALTVGHQFAAQQGEWEKANRYLNALAQLYHDVLADHVKEDENKRAYVSECPYGGDRCMARGGDIDGAVILSFIHGGWTEGTPSSVAVANTVRRLSEKFCDMYPINQQDTNQGLPGILYGRYELDQYGGGNPWVLITAALASLFYQAARVVTQGAGPYDSAEAREAWRAALFPTFNGTAGEFAAAGDAVLTRLMAHVAATAGHQLYEQLDKVTGLQYNAPDLTWSYAEVLSAMRYRDEALAAMHGKLFV